MNDGVADESKDGLAQTNADAETGVKGNDGPGPINVIDNSRGAGLPTGGPGGADQSAGMGGAFPMTGFGNLGMDSAYLNPVLQ